ncbi:MAG: OpgC domain-containing protein [Pirellulales bacterium]|nr:OpgC domain-containing protein [Pirellulales bacterium]
MRSPNSETTRDEKLDFWRGLCIVGMVSWHLMSHPSYPRALAFAVIQSFNFVAEGFVLLAGASIGWQFRRRPTEISRAGPHLARAGRFLLLHWAIAAALVVLITSTTLYEPVQPRSPIEWARDVLLLEYQPYLGDVLSVFIFLFALAPAMLFVLRRAGAWALLALSLAVFAVAVTWPRFAALNAHGAFVVNGWQIYFVLGILFGRGYPEVLAAWQRRPNAWLVLNLAICAAISGYRLAIELDPDWEAQVPAMLRFERHPLTLARTVEMLADMHLVALVTARFWPWLEPRRVTGWLVRFGRKSLRVFVVSIGLDYLICGLLTATGWGMPVNVALWWLDLVVLYGVATWGVPTRQRAS